MYINKLITDTTQYMSNIKHYRESKYPVLLIGVTDKLTIYYTGKDDADFSRLIGFDYNIIEYPSNGGTAVSQPGDLGFYLGIPGKHQGWSLYVYKYLLRWLSTLGINAKIINNDFTIHGKKLMGYTETIDGIYSHSAIFVAMTNSKELIDLVCLKPKNKDVGGFNEYGITNAELIEKVELATTQYLELIGVI